MFEEELKNEKKTLDTLSRNMDSIQRRYLSKAEELKRQFDKIDGSAEEEIENAISSLKKELEKICSDLQNELDNNLKENKKTFSQLEKSALDQIQDYRKKCEKDFEKAALSMMIVKGEL